MHVLHQSTALWRELRRISCRNARRSGSEAQAGAWQYQFSLWCLNPACIFEAIGAQARSVIVTSGTLAPMTSFQSELGIPIAQQLEAPHVVAKSQARPLYSASYRFCVRIRLQHCRSLAALLAKQSLGG